MSKKFKLGVIGSPIEHSLSPFIHSRFSRNENINIEYLPYKVDEQDFDLFIKEFFSDKDSKGLNVTLPHKKKAAEIKGTFSFILLVIFVEILASEGLIEDLAGTIRTSSNVNASVKCFIK